MAQALTVTMTKLGANQAIARAVPLSSTPTSIDFVTLNHGLGRTPQKVAAHLRSLVSGASAGAPIIMIDTYDQTKIIIRLSADNGASPVVTFDVHADLVHSIVA